jgi:hypothetical protein
MRYALVLVLLILSPLAASEKWYEVQGVLVKGVRQVDKLQLVRKGMKRKGANLLVNIELMEEGCRSHPLVSSCRVSIEKKIALVKVEEREVLLRFYVTGKGAARMVEVDKDYHVIHGSGLESSNVPVVILDERDYGKSLRVQLKRMFSLILSINKENRRLYNELKSVQVRQNGYCTVVLRKRPERYRVNVTKESFMKLGYVAGYLDREKTQGRKVVIDGNAVVIYQQGVR